MKWIGASALTSLLVGCGGSTTVVADGDDGVGAGRPAVADRPSGEWRTASIDQAQSATVPGVKPEAFTLRFFDDGRVLAQARCNSLSGEYRIEGGRFRVEAAAQTEMGCPGENRHEEDQWLAAFLTSSPTFAFDGKRIALDTDSIRVALKPREEVLPNRPLGGTRWELTHLTDGPAPGAPADPNAAVSASMAPPQTHLQFGVGLSRTAPSSPDSAAGSPPSGTLKGRSGCVDFFARAEMIQSAAASDPAGRETLRFGPMTVDDSQCKDGRTVGVDRVLAVLQGEVIARVAVGTLTLTHASGKGMQLSAAKDAPAARPGPAVDEPQTGAAEPGTVAPPLAGTWRTTRVLENSAPRTGPEIAPDAFTLTFFDDGRVSAQARCNTISGSYKLVDGRFVMDQAAQTKMGCPGENRMQEDQWLVAFLTAKPSFKYDAKRIAMTTDSATVVLEPAN